VEHDGDGIQVGELARRSGVTVRALHHYDHIGLLQPSSRSTAGYRLYQAADVERLFSIVVLRRVGLPLEQIKEALDDPTWRLVDALAVQISELDRRTATDQALRAELTGLLERVTTQPDAGQATVPELITAMEEMNDMTTTVRRRIALLVYADIEAAHRFLVDVFDLGPGALVRNDAGEVIHGEVSAGDGVIWLHPVSDRFRLQSPRVLGAATAMTAVLVDDVDAHHAHVVARGAQVVEAPVDQPYGVREYTVEGPEGELWSFMSPLTVDDL
jgi:DNA-binding transcriptional MerR regulator